MNQAKTRHYPLFIGILFYALLRSLIVLWDTPFSVGFGHDSAYIGIVARNLILGKGFVNDASWAVFMNPSSLPMPFHNANPLYILLIAGLSKISGLSIVKAGFLISALASVLLLLGTYFLVSFYLRSSSKALFIAFLVVLFPPVLLDSLKMLPDALHLGWVIVFLALLVRSESLVVTGAGGVFLGLAWLTRSSAILVVPVALLFLIWKYGWWKGMVRILVLGVAATVVASPWLLHTAHTYGSAFRSDSTYSLLQDFYSRPYGGSVEKFWRSPAPPPPVSVLRNDWKSLCRDWLRGVPNVTKIWLREGWGNDRTPTILIVLLLLCVLLIYREFVLRPLVLITCISIGLHIGVYAIRGRTTEGRYLAPITALLIIWLSTAISDLWTHWNEGRRRITVAVAFALAAALFVYVPIRAVALVMETTAEDPEGARFRRALIHLDETVTHASAVVLYAPYFYTFDTGEQALSIPTSDDAFLVRYMDRYHARWIFLTEQELSFWKPGWAGGSKLPPGIYVRTVLPEGKLFERIDCQ